jgi:hypothetical protein
MPLSFKSVGTLVTNPFTPDQDPNTAAPAASRIFEIPDLTENGERAFGVKFYPEFTNPSGGGVTVDIVPWVFDDKNGNWAAAVAESGITNYDMLVSPDFAPGRVFFQFVAQGGGTVDSVEIFAAAA